MSASTNPPGAGEQWTCGKGLAHRSTVPAKMAEYLAALARNLELHIPSIDTTDAAGRAEHEAYVGLATAYAELAAGLARTADTMRACRDLPMARHLEHPGNREVLQGFQRFVEVEEQLARLLTESSAESRSLLEQFQDHPR